MTKQTSCSRLGLHIVTPLVSLLVWGCSPSINPPVSRDKGPTTTGPTFDVNAVLQPQVIQGNNYAIEPRVGLAEDMFVFRLRTRYGIIPAQGMSMLELRLREMHSIYLAEDLGRRAHLEEGIFSGLEKTGQGLEELLTDPGGVLLRAPESFKQMIKQGLDPADRRAGNATRRKLATAVRCDPETSNPTLKFMLDEMAARQGIGSFLTGTALSAALPGLGMLSAPADMRDLVADRPPHEINKQIEVDLQQMGIDPISAKRFCRETSYTTTERLIFLMYFRSVSRLPNQRVVFDQAAQAPTEARGLAAIHETALYSALRRRHPIARFEGTTRPVAVTSDNMLIAVRAADYLSSADEVIKTISQFRAAHPTATAHVVLTGRASVSAKRDLQNARITVHELGVLP